MTQDKKNPFAHELVYQIHDRPSAPIAFLAALQHLLAIIVPIITPGFIICSAAGLSPQDTAMVLSMSLVISGVATFFQCKKIGPLGAGLLIVQGTSFNFVGPLSAGAAVMVASGHSAHEVMATIFGVVIAGSFIEMTVSRILPFIKKMITPLVTGIVVLLIGLTLIKEGLISMGGGYASMGPQGSFASLENLSLSCSVFILIILFNRVNIAWVRSSAIILALIIGYGIAGFLGRLDFSGFENSAIFALPSPMHFGLSFSWSLFIPLIIIYLVTSLEAVGDITATSKISGEPVSGPLWMRRIKGGVLVNGANSLLAGVFNTFPSSVFAQNNGIIQLTGLASRYIGLWIAVILIIMGLFPKIAALIQAMPEPVLGGAAMIMFGSVAASGINILSAIQLDRRALLIIAIALAVGVGVPQVPDFVAHLPSWLADILKSGLAAGGITAIVLNLVLPETQKSVEE
ncbi:uracil-xanthine permease family protein [Bartonella tamiae]|uniref:Xanthine permease n=1 Tax=Bartonella tamiae Th239 TaxID=1094558 RepID=J0ZLP4_9HYPH|nr:nucleobase:cation symporter-2 family protein [Bartonella tamiae]EJF89343.1 xanthine permease [Bartonella tamiae Th239]EJF92792.1 xanthine permease [Bartonella tamiae Th307]